jgi:hypothetical protein
MELEAEFADFLGVFGKDFLFPTEGGGFEQGDERGGRSEDDADRGAALLALEAARERASDAAERSRALGHDRSFGDSGAAALHAEAERDAAAPGAATPAPSSASAQRRAVMRDREKDLADPDFARPAPPTPGRW